MSQDTAAITSGGVTLVFLGGTATTIWTIEHWGRRPVFFWGAVLCSLWMILFTIGLAVNTQSSSKLAVASIFLFEFFFGASWCSSPWVYVPEIAPLQYRHIGTSMGIFGQWIITFIVSRIICRHTVIECPSNKATGRQIRPNGNRQCPLEVLSSFLCLQRAGRHLRVVRRQRNERPEP